MLKNLGFRLKKLKKFRRWIEHMKQWTRQESKERFPKPITPLGWSLLFVPLDATLLSMSRTLGVKKYSPNDMILWHNFTIYTRKNFFTSLKNLKFHLPRLIQILGLAVISFGETLYQQYKEQGKFKDRFFNRVFKKIFEKQIVQLIGEWPNEISHLKEIMGRDFKLDTISELDYEKFFKIRSKMQEDSKRYFAEDFNVYFLKNCVYELLKSQLKNSGLSVEDSTKLLSSLSNGLKGNFSVQMIVDFNDSAITSDELKKRYGHLTDNWDLYHPTLGEVGSIWKERGTLKSQSPLAVLAQQQTVQKILKALSWNPDASKLVHWLQELIIIDEDLRAYSSLQYPQARKLFALVEKTSIWRELIVEKDDIYFLHLNEIEHGLKKNDFHPYYDLIRERRSAFIKAQTQIAPFELEQNNLGTIKQIKLADELSQILKGVCVSEGSVEGEVIKINSYSDLAKISKKSILVLESATPIYAPFYALSGGIVSEMGGQLSHGAIVAREYGIPMLTGVENACVILQDGQRIFLDADTGIIKVKD